MYTDNRKPFARAKGLSPYVSWDTAIRAFIAVGISVQCMWYIKANLGAYISSWEEVPKKLAKEPRLREFCM